MNASVGSYRADIDGLRAVAVLSVVLGHMRLPLPGGFVGVDVFFVISGYLITGIILREIERGGFSMARFWERRIRRIMPALLVMTLTTLVVGWFVLLPGDYASLGRSVQALALLGSNVFFRNTSGYFAPGAETLPLLHTWSLAVEEQFYLLVPLLLACLNRRGPRPGRTFGVLAALALASFALSVRDVFVAPSSAFYLLPSRAWELFAGSLLAIRPPLRAVEVRWRRELASALGLALIVAPCFLYSDETPFPGAAALPPVLGTALVILAGTATTRLPAASRLLASRPAVGLGLISYSVYLWHWPLLVFNRAAATSTLIGRAERLGLVAASLILGALSWRFVEQPFRDRKLLPTRRRVWAFGASAFAVLIAAGSLLVRGDGYPGRLPPRARRFYESSRQDLETYHRQFLPGDVPGNLTRLGVPGASPSFLVWGDSHASALVPGIDELAAEGGVAGLAATHGHGAPVLGYVFDSEVTRNRPMLAYNRAVAEYAASGQVSAVVLVGHWGPYFRDPGFADRLLETVDFLRRAGLEVYFMEDVPSFEGYDVNHVVNRLWHGGASSPRDASGPSPVSRETIASRAEYERLAPELHARGVHILDPTPILRARSGAGDLRPFDAERSFYHDSNHLSVHGARALRTLFDPLIHALNRREPAPGVTGPTANGPPRPLTAGSLSPPRK